MKISMRRLILTLCFASFLITYTNCSPGFTSSGVTGSSSVFGLPALVNNPPIATAAMNVLPVSVGCGGQGYPNEPCVSVTLCVPGTSQCQTVNNILLDTGSYGLRVFSSSLSSISLPTTGDPNVSGNTLAECMSYGDGSSDWGPVAKATVIMGSETASNVPVQLINSTFANAPSDCTDLDTGFSQTGFNGILGVGLFAADCGDGCAPTSSYDNSSNGIYYTCTTAGVCTGAAVATALQVTNPVTMLASDNNGVILELPPVNPGGTVSASGSLVIGIGTQSNNQPINATSLPADDYGNFVTVFNGQSMTQSFIDSGSETLMFPSSTLNQCTGNDAGFYCPATETVLTATQQGANGTGSVAVTFAVGNTDVFFASNNPNFVFSDLAAPMDSDFDWGLPFFLGRDVYIGFDAHTSQLGAGPLWAF